MDKQVADRVAVIWARTLGLRHVGLDDDFADLGGDSLLALMIIDQITEEYPSSDPYRLAETRTVREVEEAISSAQIA